MQCIYENFLFPPDQPFNIQSELLENKDCNSLKSHKYFEIALLENYGGKHFIGDNILDFKGTQLLLLGSYLPHCSQYDKKLDPKAPSQAISIHFFPDFLGKQILESPEAKPLNDLFNKASKGISFSGPTLAKAKKVVKEMLLAKGMTRTGLMLQLLDILAQSNTKQVLSSSYFNIIENADEGQKISKVYDYVFQNFSKNISLPAIANILPMAPAAFCRFFKKKTTRTLLEFIKEVRIGHAAKLLLEDKHNISEIAYLCGYNNSSNFNKQFKELIGVSPREFQRQYQLKYKAGDIPYRSVPEGRPILSDKPALCYG
nr:AraC family transcriptional regulator [Pedobacter sp. ASV19]